MRLLHTFFAPDSHSPISYCFHVPFTDCSFAPPVRDILCCCLPAQWYSMEKLGACAILDARRSLQEGAHMKHLRKQAFGMKRGVFL